MASIDFSTASTTLQPIGAQNSAFVGVYNGNGQSLSNFTIHADTGLVGLLEYDGRHRTYGGRERNGHCGSGADNAGLLVGELYGVIEDSYATGTVSGPANVGGLGNAHTTVGSYASTTVTATSYTAGGLNAAGGDDGVVYDTFASSNVTAPSGKAYDLTPPVNSTAQVSDSFYDSSKCTSCTNVDATGKSTSYFYDQTNAPLSSWDFDTIWMAHPDGLPTLR